MYRIRLLLSPAKNYIANLWATLTIGWDRFWFTPADPATLSTMRIVAGLILLFVYLSSFSERLELVGPHGWIDTQAIDELHSLGSAESAYPDAAGVRWWGRSIWDNVRNETVTSLLYYYLIGAATCFTIGFCSRAANFFALAGHLSFVHRSYAAWSGMDSILAMVLLYLLIGPTGALFSVDNLLRRRRARRAGQQVAPIKKTWQANVAIRMVQIHMCIVYLCSGLSKLQGENWWDGSAVLRSIMGYELAPFNLLWLGQLDDATLEWISSLAVLTTLVFEIGFAFLIWNRLLRPLFLIVALMLHVGIGALMGLYAFAAIMLTGCLAFVAPESIRWIQTVITNPASAAKVTTACETQTDATTACQVLN